MVRALLAAGIAASFYFAYTSLLPPFPARFSRSSTPPTLYSLSSVHFLFFPVWFYRFPSLFFDTFRLLIFLRSLPLVRIEIHSGKRRCDGEEGPGRLPSSIADAKWRRWSPREYRCTLEMLRRERVPRSARIRFLFFSLSLQFSFPFAIRRASATRLIMFLTSMSRNALFLLCFPFYWRRLDNAVFDRDSVEDEESDTMEYSLVCFCRNVMYNVE